MNGEPVRQIASSDPRALAEFVRLERRLVGSYALFISDVDSDVTKRLEAKSAFLSEAANAVAHMLGHHARGKVVITV